MNPRTHALPLTPWVRPLTRLLLLIVMGGVFTTTGLRLREAGERLEATGDRRMAAIAEEA